MRVKDIAEALEAWAPPWVAWERDNVGLQVGNGQALGRRILLALDVTEAVVREAVRRRVQLIVSHHPLLFRPPKTIVDSNPVGRLVLSLAEQKIAVYSAHTNLDFIRDGVSFTLAQALGVQQVRFLSPLKDLLAKLIVFVPAAHVNSVRTAMARAGAGRIGEYDECSFEIFGHGTFKGSQDSRPVVGARGQLERIDEVRLEMVLPRARVRDVVDAMKRAHPYDEVAYDVFLLDNESPNYGSGAVGTLERHLTLSAFLRRVRTQLKANVVRYVGNPRATIKTVVVCGGSGSELLNDAIRAHADAFVTADVRYHTFHEADGRIALIDAGHWETEHVVLPEMKKRLLRAASARKEHLEIMISRTPTNPIHST